MGTIEMDNYSYTGDEQSLLNNWEELEERVDSAYGVVKVSIYGDRSKHPIITFHDIGLDSENNFQNFFQFGTVVELTNRFCVYNINAPGQEINSRQLPDNYVYPTMDALAQIVANVVKHFKFKTFVGFGVGAGANVLLRYALDNPNSLDALILVNACISTAGWIEWFYQKLNVSYLQSRGMTSFTIDYLMWHQFGNRLDQCNQDIVRQYRIYFQNHPNPRNLAFFMESYLNRTEIVLRDPVTNDFLLQVPVLQLVGGRSAFVDETVNVNANLNPAQSEWVKLSGSCGLVLDDKPENVTESIVLFLQGLGFFASLNVHSVIKALTNLHREQVRNPISARIISQQNVTEGEYLDDDQPEASV